MKSQVSANPINPTALQTAANPKSHTHMTKSCVGFGISVGAETVCGCAR